MMIRFYFRRDGIGAGVVRQKSGSIVRGPLLGYKAHGHWYFTTFSTKRQLCLIRV